MYKEQQDQLEQDMAPFGFVDNGIDEPVDDSGDEFGWSEPVVKVRNFNNPFD